jgi:hypothetical protein
MKKFISAVLGAAMLAAPVVPAMAEEDTVSVIINNEEVTFDQPPVIEDGTTLVPIRAVFEKAGADVSWDQDTQTATLIRGNYTVNITLNDTVLYKNGVQVALAKPAQMINDRVLIPVRAIGEAMDFNIAWDGFHSQVVVSTDGANYRPYSSRRVAFQPLANAADFYSDSTFTCQNVDVSGDGVTDTVSFTTTFDTETAETPLLLINGDNYTNQLMYLHIFYSFAVVDVNKSDNSKEIVITANGDCLTAYFFRLNGTELEPIMMNGKQMALKYVSNLFFDGKGYVLSDLEGVTWTDIMLTGSAYQLKDGVFTQYYVDNTKKILPRMLVHTYNEHMVYKVYDTNDFNKGSYANKQPDRIMQSSDFDSFTVQDIYIDEKDPSYIELFITIPNGPNMVIVPYST